ncbi:hypothetical protein [Iningainema tapete]|uniref:Uncharacterized protein n=1 Tax=Iningainema tapete BLCC-T55 TaxID=2748662 RepID=A0A8J6XJV4_9CYAN|nr:hypothetical protein [Iningainema tapete]MBD2772849.1 hypothetical protein [Iningainema tapete BLCC-T55]
MKLWVMLAAFIVSFLLTILTSSNFVLGANATVVAQQITDPNIIGQMQKAFNHFVQTGQVWALLIGLCIGYMIRNLTSYG